MKSKWIISNLGHRDNIEKLSYSIQEIGRDCSVLNLEEISNLCYELNTKKECIITRGSIWSNSNFKKHNPYWVGNCHSKESFLCSSYYPFLGKYLTQKNYIFLPFSELIRKIDWIYKILGKEDKIFLRPDSGEKEFSGEIVHKNMFEHWKENTYRTLEYASIPHSIMCVVSSPEDVYDEYRLLIVDKKVITGSSYRIAKHIHQEQICKIKNKDIIDFAETVINDNYPILPRFHVLDISRNSTGENSVMEVGCFCCCGLYEMDFKSVALSVSECCENMYNTVE